jgi:dihydroflavonol-4-reductase
MNIAVTGANGHIGSNLCTSLLAQGYNVKALIHHKSNALEGVNLEIIHGSILDSAVLDKLLENVDCCFHLAAIVSIESGQSDKIWSINAEGTRNMIDAALRNRIARFIHFSTIHAFQQNPLNEVLDEQRPLVGTRGMPYDVSKAAGERMVFDAVSKGLNATVLCPTAVIGPPDPEPSLTGKAVLEMIHHQIPALIPGGYDWVDVRDVADAAIKAISHGKIGEKYILSGKYHSLLQVSKLLAAESKKKTPQTILPMWLAWFGLPFIQVYSTILGIQPIYTRNSLKIISESNQQITNAKARRELGFDPRPLEETIRDLFAWFSQKEYL